MKRFGVVVESAPNAMVMVRQDGRIAFANSAAEALFGYTRGELTGQPIELLIPGRHVDQHRKDRRRFTEAPQARLMGAGRDLFARRKDGREIPVEIGLNPVETDEGPMVLGAIIDLTQRKLAAAEILRLNAELEWRVAERTEQLQAANKELEAFAYSISHDLRAPLRHIDGFSKILLEQHTEQLDDTGRDYLGRVRTAAQRMGDLIDALLGLSRLTRTELVHSEVDLTHMAVQVGAELRKTYEGRDVCFEIEDGIVAYGDARLLRVVLDNLLANAWKFTGCRAQARIEFGSGLHERERMFFVRDNGTGFDMEYAGRLFGAFQRLHTATEYPGSGIGLATVSRIVARHGGRVWAEGHLGEGATFYFTLPGAERPLVLRSAGRP